MSRIFFLLGLSLFLASGARAQGAFVNWETPHVSPLTLTANGARLLAVNTPDNRLEVFAMGTGLPVYLRSIPVGLDPVSVRARTNTEVWVVNHVSDSVSVVDLANGNVMETLATDDEPCDVVFAGIPERAFVSCSQANTVLVFDPAQLSAAPVRIDIRGEDPRAMAVSPAGDQVYVAIFESGNQTTLLSGFQFRPAHYPPNSVSDADGPYGGVNPPPNDGAAFDPPLTPGLPEPPPVGLIVRKNAAGLWLDDNGGDWTEFVSGSRSSSSGRVANWKLLDHDVAIIDTDTLAVTYADGLMNLNMALAVNPASGEVTVVGTEATNEVRFEPIVSGTFVRSHSARFAPTQPAQVTVSDLNPQLDYTEATVPVAVRELALGDPRGIAWNADGSRAYVTGMGSNNVVVLDGQGRRLGPLPASNRVPGLGDKAIDVGEGPTGIVFDAARAQLYVLNKFESSLSVVAAATEREITRVPFFDPSPSSIKRGRKHLYDTHETSGTGVVSCASCHIDARMDRLAWDLGNPAGEMKVVDETQNIGDVPGLGLLPSYRDWHPMKGPMLTQTMQDIIGKEPLHWRGDRDGIEEFNPAFMGLLGDDEPLSPSEMQEFEDFLATIFFPPNPFRNFDNSLPTDLPLPGHFTSGANGPMDLPLPNGNAVQGLADFRPPSQLAGGSLSCVTCHTRPTGASTDHEVVDSMFVPFPVGPSGEHHLALAGSDGLSRATRKVPQLRNIYERTGFILTQPESLAGFGFMHDGNVDTIARFLNEPVFAINTEQQTADMVAFMLAFGGDTKSEGFVDSMVEAPGPPSQSTHAAVGKQLTLDGPATPAEDALLDDMLTLAAAQEVGLVVKGKSGGIVRGWSYVAGDFFQSDRKTQTASRAALEAIAAPLSELTFTVVPWGSARRIGIDRDSDGWFDRDELDASTDPADAAAHPAPTVRYQQPSVRSSYQPRAAAQ